nr:hypothetical protein [Tanacetum cinerariifolium]
MDLKIERDDLNQKFLTSLAPEWLLHTIVWRNRSDLDTMSLDDLYNHLKVYESKVKKKSKPNIHNMAFISSAKHNRGNEDVNTAGVSTASTNVPTASANIKMASISQDTACAYISSQSSDGSRCKGCRAPRSQDRGRRDNYRQGSKVKEQAPKALMAIDGVGWDWSYMVNDEENHALVADKEAPIEFALMANISVESKVFDNSLCSKDCKKNTDNLNSKITDLTDKLFDAKNMIYKLGLAQVESRLVDHKDREIKYYEKIRGLELEVEFKTNSLEYLDNLLESQRLDKNMEGLGYSVVPPPPAQLYYSPKKNMSWTGLLEFKDDTVTDYSRHAPIVESSSDDAQNRNPFVTEEASPSTISPTSFIKFVKANDSPTKSKIDKAEKAKISPVKYAEQYKKPTKKPNVRGNQKNWNNLKSHQLGPNFVTKKNACFNYGDFNHLAYDCRKRVKKETSRSQNTTHKSFTPRPIVHKPYKPPMRPVRSNMNGAKPNRTSFNKPTHSYTNRPFQRISAVRSQYRAPWVSTVNKNFPLVNRKFSTVSRKFSTFNRKFPTANKKFPTGGTKFSTADMGKKGKAVKPSACWFWKPSQNLSNKGPNSNIVSVMFKKYTYIDTQGRLKRNRTLIEAARTILADAKLPVTFSTEAVNTACYVQNRVLVNKSQNKTPYELFNGRTPAIGFIKPFGCHVMILNTLDNLGKFEAKGMKVTLLDTLCTKDAARQEVKKDVSSLRYIALPNWVHDVLLESSSSKPQDDCRSDVPESSGNSNHTATSINPPADQLETLTVETPIPTISSPVLTACFTDSLEPSIDSDGVEVDVSNMETTITASPTLTLRIHKDHPKSQIIGPVDTLVQTRNKSKEVGEQSFIATIHQKTDPAVLQFCLFSCFLSQVEPKKIFDALQDPSWVEAMQEELLQFKIQNVWTLVDCPKGDPEFPAKVYKVEKAMYGLHQAPRAWKRGDFILVQVYMDDIIFGSSNPQLCREFEALMHEKFQMSVMGELNFFLGLQVLQKEDGIFLTQDKYASVTPKEYHLHAIKRIFRYLKGYPKLGLWYPKESPFDLVAYSDSDYGGATQDRKSTTRGCQFLGRRVKAQAHQLSPITHPPLRINTHHILLINHQYFHLLSLPLFLLLPPSDTPTLRKYTRRARIAQSSALLLIADEPTSLLRDVSKGEACPTDSGFEADQDRANIAKSSTLSHDSAPRVTFLAADEGSMQLKLDEMMGLCASLNLDEGEVAAERVSDDKEEMETVLTSMDVATVLASGVVKVPTSSGSILTAGPPATEVPIGSDVVPTAGPIFATATVVTPYIRRKGKETMVESKTPKKKKIQEQMDIQMARQLEEDMERDAQRMNEQIARDAEIARIQAEKELRIELISDLIKYQDNYAKVYKFQTQQRKPWYKKQKSDYYMAIIKSNLGWNVKDFRGMTFEEIKAKFTTVWKQFEDFIPMGSKEEAKRLKRKGLSIEQESVKKLKTSKEVLEEVKSPDEVPEEKVKEMMQLVPIEEVYIEALQVKHPIIDLKVHTEGQRSYWKITRLGGSSASYQFFIDMLKHLDREDLNQLWALVKESVRYTKSTGRSIELCLKPVEN